MHYHHIMVHVDNSRACPERVASAISVAQRDGAKLHGYCVVPELSLAIYADVPLPADIIDSQVKVLEGDLLAAEARFVDAVNGTDVEWECTTRQGPAGELLGGAARYVDLTVVGQPDPDDPKCTAADVAATVAFRAGSAVLVVPPGGARAEPGERIAIAWNGSREAQRAVQDALPLLQRAERIDVLCVVDASGRVHGQLHNESEQPAQKLCDRLSRHGVAASPHYLAPGAVDEGLTLLERCADLDSSLLVLGAYGHSRLREFLLGGVTRSVLDEHTLPVLIAH